MRRRLALTVMLLSGSASAWGQATVNQGALDQLAPRSRTESRPAARPARTPDKPAPPAKPPTRPTAQATTPPRPPARPPAVPTVPPAIAALPPPILVPVAPPPPPPVVPLVADAPGAVAPLPGGLRATFGSDRADLNAATESAIRRFAAEVKPNERQAVNVLAYAAGSADDPSTPRRLSLARALAARAVLINEGIPSTRIYVRALGSAIGDGPADRVDLTRAPGAAP